ncbi:hypothetical protein BBP40_008944 [Aspergillus hancockii]|nr:hypothetical protein BBP40_008944 [Aspergillus hancockii]
MASARPYRHFGSDGSVITKVHRDDQNLLIVDRLLEPQTIVHFLECCQGAPFPNGKTSEHTRLTLEECRLLNEGEDSVLARVGNRIGSMGDRDRLCNVGKNIHSIKSRSWEGIIPLSEQRWREKGLDHGANFDLACQHLSAVVAAFEYLNKPAVANNLRDTFNLILDHWAEGDAMLNARRREQGQELVDVARLWMEFIAAHYEVTTARAHRWVISHVNALRKPLLDGLVSHRPISENVVDNLQWKMTDRLHLLMEISATADFRIMIPMHGYKGYTAPMVEPNIPAALRSTDSERRAKEYSQRLKMVTRMTMFQNVCSGSRGHSQGIGSPESLHRTAVNQIEAQNKVRREMRGEPIEPVPKEPWIVRCLSRVLGDNQEPIGGYGLAIYRLTYQQNNAEWAQFVQKLEAHAAEWGLGQTGSNAIKPHLKLHWLDGRVLGIPEGDLEAAKKHYHDHAIPSFDHKDHVNDRVFLVVDDASVASYMGTSYSAATDFIPAGDFSGFVLAVDAHYDPKEGLERPEESPGFYGQMRILGNLIWGDLYAMLLSQSAFLSDLWPLALDHPNQVYVGPTVPLQVKCWRIQNGMRSVLVKQMVEYARAKVNGTAPSLPVVPPSLSSRRNEPNTAMRNYLLREFTQHLRQNGNIQEAVLAEEAMNLRPGEEPDWDRIQRRMDPDRETGGSNTQNGEGPPDGQCHPQ